MRTNCPDPVLLNVLEHVAHLNYSTCQSCWLMVYLSPSSAKQIVNRFFLLRLYPKLHLCWNQCPTILRPQFIKRKRQPSQTLNTLFILTGRFLPHSFAFSTQRPDLRTFIGHFLSIPCYFQSSFFHPSYSGSSSKQLYYITHKKYH